MTLNVVVHTYNPRIQELEAGTLGVKGQFVLHIDILLRWKQEQSREVLKTYR